MFSAATKTGGGASATPSNGPYVDDVFSPYLYTGTGATQSINNGIALVSSTSGGFGTPTAMSAGVPWATPTTFGSKTIGQFNGMAVNSAGLYVGVGNDDNNYPMFATSSDGITWSNPALINNSTSNILINSVAVNSAGKFVAVGFYNDGTGAPVYATSTNGTTWTSPAKMNGSTNDARMYAVTVNSAGLFVAVGWSYPSFGPVYATSSDGSTWTTPAPMNGSSTRAQMTSIAVNSAGLFVATGNAGNGAPLYATSSNGSTWTTPATMNGSNTAAYIKGMTVNSAGVFVAVGYNNSGYPLYATSNNGSTWTTPATMNGSSAGAYMYGIAVNSSGLFVAVGYYTSPVYATSSDGSTWTTPGLMNGSTSPANIVALTVNSAGKFVAVGSDSNGLSDYATATFVTTTGYGGMVWVKDRTNAYNNCLFDTVQGATKLTHSNTTDATSTDANSLTVFNSNGFTLGTGNTSGNQVNTSTNNFVSWTFRQAPKFFQVVQYTGTGANQAINHNLGSTPGCILIKQTSGTANWAVYHSLNAGQFYLQLNTNAAAVSDSTYWNNTAATSTQFTVGTNAAVNSSGQTYIAYIFANQAGGFGTTGTDSAVACGYYAGTGAAGNFVSLGWEPQYVMIKRYDSTGDWQIQDVMRGMSNTSSASLFADTTAAETLQTPSSVIPNATGFTLNTTNAITNANGGTYIYVAIRRPDKPPTSGTSVFSPLTRTGTGASASITNIGFPPYFTWSYNTSGSYANGEYDKLRGIYAQLIPGNSLAEASYSDSLVSFDESGYSVGIDAGGAVNASGQPYVNWNFNRAPTFFDEVCYTGDGTNNRQISHNLTVAPQLIIAKSRSDVNNWPVWCSFYSTGATNTNGTLTTTAAFTTNSAFGTTGTMNNSSFSVANYGTTLNGTNNSGSNYVAYLFATCAGVSKVGSYTGTGGTQTINCGFGSGGARYLLIKRTDSTGGWYCFDSARGLTSSSSPYVTIQGGSGAQTTGNNGVFAAATGFTINATANATVNINGASYIFLAIA